MPKGLKLPIEVTPRGGAKTVYGTPYTRQTVLAGLTPNHSRNPFQTGGGVEVGISDGVVFSVNDAGARARATRDVRRWFARARANEVAKLLPGNDGISFEDAVASELTASVRYLELEADREGEVEVNLTNAQRSSPGSVGA